MMAGRRAAGRRQEFVNRLGTMTHMIRGCVASEPECLVMLWAYFDDSSDEKRERFCAAGGLFTSHTVWERLEAAWLNRVPELAGKTFHAADCECGWGEFADWPKSRRDRVMAQLCGLIKEFDLGAFGSCVSVADYKSVWPDADVHDPYLLCVATCIAHTAEISEMASQQLRGVLPPDSVQFWFEDNGKTASRETAIFSSFKGLAGWPASRQLSGVAHMGKALLGLQAADLIAREVFKHFDNEGVRPTRKPVISLSSHVSFHCWTMDELKYLHRNGGPHDAKSHAVLAAYISKLPKSARRTI